MTDTATERAQASPGGAFSHVLYPYVGREAFLQGLLAFIAEARDADEAVVAAVPEAKRHALRSALPPGASVTFVDLAELGRNPARLIPAWQEWVSTRTRDGQAVRGIEECAWPRCDAARTGELRYHEWLLNLAFAQSPAWMLLCPYDTALADESALLTMTRYHPTLWRDGTQVTSENYVDTAQPYPFGELAEPRAAVESMGYERGRLAAVRDKIAHWALANRLAESRLRDLQVAASEVATNSILHAGGGGTLRVWVQDHTLVCEFSDSGFLKDPLAGRARPNPAQIGGRGLWLVHHLCDLVEVRSSPSDGTRIRLHMDLPSAGPAPAEPDGATGTRRSP